jgi:hypothetical protein
MLLSPKDIKRVGKFITSLDCLCNEFGVEWQFDDESGDVTVYDPVIDLFEAHRWSLGVGYTGLPKAESGFMGRPSIKSVIPVEGSDV